MYSPPRYDLIAALLDISDQVSALELSTRDSTTEPESALATLMARPISRQSGGWLEAVARAFSFIRDPEEGRDDAGVWTTSRFLSEMMPTLLSSWELEHAPQGQLSSVASGECSLDEHNICEVTRELTEAVYAGQGVGPDMDITP